ncbi:MAG: hypothetical protein CMM61_17690 [Rhodospirillaceae bacterium]|nr:hypothetical protein [Rhodospirillaceae bacterium]
MLSRLFIAPLLALLLSAIQPAPAARAQGIDAAAVAEAVRSVVVVLPRWRNVRPGFAPRSGDPRVAPEGSGVAILAGGYVVTNDHVLGDAISVSLRLADGRRAPAEIVGRHKATDIALLKTTADLTVAEPGPMPGIAAPVCAIGNPFGRGLSVSCGVVSAIGRANAGFNEIEDFIQTDAAVNPGGSGGALVDGRGRFVGMVSAIFAQGSDANIGVNFAASRRLVDRVVRDLAEFGAVREGTAGIDVRPLTPEEAAVNAGVGVVEVARDGPALAAGIEAGDIVTRVGDRPVTAPGEFHAALFRHRPGAEVQMTVRRGDVERQVTVTLAPQAP